MADPRLAAFKPVMCMTIFEPTAEVVRKQRNSVGDASMLMPAAPGGAAQRMSIYDSPTKATPPSNRRSYNETQSAPVPPRRDSVLDPPDPTPHRLITPPSSLGTSPAMGAVPFSASGSSAGSTPPAKRKPIPVQRAPFAPRQRQNYTEVLLPPLLPRTMISMISFFQATITAFLETKQMTNVPDPEDFISSLEQHFQQFSAAVELRFIAQTLRLHHTRAVDIVKQNALFAMVPALISLLVEEYQTQTALSPPTATTTTTTTTTTASDAASEGPAISVTAPGGGAGAAAAPGTPSSVPANAALAAGGVIATSRPRTSVGARASTWADESLAMAGSSGPAGPTTTSVPSTPKSGVGPGAGAGTVASPLPTGNSSPPSATVDTVTMDEVSDDDEMDAAEGSWASKRRHAVDDDDPT